MERAVKQIGSHRDNFGVDGQANRLSVPPAFSMVPVEKALWPANAAVMAPREEMPLLPLRENVDYVWACRASGGPVILA